MVVGHEATTLAASRKQNSDADDVSATRTNWTFCPTIHDSDGIVTVCSAEKPFWNSLTAATAISDDGDESNDTWTLQELPRPRFSPRIDTVTAILSYDDSPCGVTIVI